MADFENGFVGNLAWFSAGHTAPSYGGNPFNAVRSHLTYLLSHDVEEASFTKDDRSRILQELKQYQTRYDATIAGKFFLSLPNDFNTKDIRQFIDSVMPEPVKYEYVVHRSKNKNGQENLHVHILLHPINTVTGKKLRWRKKELSQIHKNYRNTLERFGYNLVTHTDKGEEPSIHAGQRAHYLPEAQEYLAVNRELGKLEKEEEQAMQEKGIPQEISERYKRLNKEQKKTFWERYIEARKEVEKFFPEEPSGSILIDLFIFVLNLLFVSEEEYHKYWAEFEKQLRQSELDELKKLPPEKVLGALNIQYKKQGNAFVFSAPYRQDTNPSCRIEPSRYGDWHFVDFGTGQQGTYIDLLLAYGYTYKQSIDLLRKVRKTLDKAEAGQRSLTLAIFSVSLRKSAPPKERLGEKEVNLRVEPIQQHPETLNYILKTRGYKTVPDFVKWISDGKHVGYGTIDLNGDAHIRFVGKSDIKEYCTGSSTVTLIKGKDSSQVVVTEGIHDAISLVNYGLTSDIIILNGVGNINKALPLIQQYHKVYACTDNDRVGQETAKTLIQACLKQKIPVYKIVFKSKDIDEAWRNQELLHVTQINPDKYWER